MYVLKNIKGTKIKIKIKIKIVQKREALYPKLGERQKMSRNQDLIYTPLVVPGAHLRSGKLDTVSLVLVGMVRD